MRKLKTTLDASAKRPSNGGVVKWYNMWLLPIRPEFDSQRPYQTMPA